MKTTLREPHEWVTMRWMDENSDLPRLLLIGDSIVNGHVALLNDKLSGHYSVDGFTTSKIVSDHEYLSDMEFTFSKHKYEIIVFNNGLHGIEVDDEDYAAELFNVLSELKTRTKHLFWRNSTPCYSKADGEQNPWIEKVPLRNDLAAIEVRKAKISTIDCYSALENQPELVADGVHFHTEGYQLIADTIAEFLVKATLVKE
jgi:hypothetical protein